MARGRREARPPVDIWPGFVDALSTLLLAVIFMLVVFVLGQFFLGQALQGRDRALTDLQRTVDQLTAQMEAERDAAGEARAELGQSAVDLELALRDRDALAERAAAAERREGALASSLDEAGRRVEATAEERDRVAADRDEAARGRSDALAGAERLRLQVQALSAQLAGLAGLLREREGEVDTQGARIADLGRRLNAALAGKVEELTRYRSEFFGRLRRALGERDDVRIVGDRFVFQSEVLFASGEVEIGAPGREQLARLARAFLELVPSLPADIPWVLQVDGHTDRRPIASARFPSNWELSTARAIAVARLLIEQGVPADRVAARGFAENQPLDPDDGSEASLRRNRRIELQLTTR